MKTSAFCAFSLEEDRFSTWTCPELVTRKLYLPQSQAEAGMGNSAATTRIDKIETPKMASNRSATRRGDTMITQATHNLFNGTGGSSIGFLIDRCQLATQNDEGSIQLGGPGTAFFGQKRHEGGVLVFEPTPPLLISFLALLTLLISQPQREPDEGPDNRNLDEQTDYAVS